MQRDSQDTEAGPGAPAPAATIDAPGERFEPCAGYRADPDELLPICAECGCFEEDHTDRALTRGRLAS